MFVCFVCYPDVDLRASVQSSIGDGDHFHNNGVHHGREPHMSRYV